MIKSETKFQQSLSVKKLQNLLHRFAFGTKLDAVNTEFKVENIVFGQWAFFAVKLEK